MKDTFTRIKSQLTFGLATISLAIVPINAAFAILPMASEIFQPETAAMVSNSQTALPVDDPLSIEDSAMIENDRIEAFSNKNSFSNFISKSKQLIVLEEYPSTIQSD